jgi:Uncharacterized protein conserved in bacteria (DUF2171)
MRSHESISLRSGWLVYGADGAKIGTVADTSTNYFVVEKGGPAASDLFVPRSAVVAVSGERVDLKFTKDELEAGNFTFPIGVARSNPRSDTEIEAGPGSRPTTAQS